MKKPVRKYFSKYDDCVEYDFIAMTRTDYPNGGNITKIQFDNKKDMWDDIRSLKNTFSDSVY